MLNNLTLNYIISGGWWKPPSLELSIEAQKQHQTELSVEGKTLPSAFHCFLYYAHRLVLSVGQGQILLP